MLVRVPLVEAEQDSSIRIEDLTKIGMVRSCLGLAEERLVPFEATRHIAYADDRPGAFHDVFSRRLTLRLSCGARTRTASHPDRLRAVSSSRLLGDVPW